MERVLKAVEKVAAKQEEMQQTLGIQGALLHEVMRQLKGGVRPPAPTGVMPEGVRLPLDSEEEFHSLEDRLNCDEACFNALVSLKHFICLFLIRQNHCMDLLLALPAQALRFCRSYVQLLFMSSNVEQRPLRWHMNSKYLPTFFLKIQIK